MSQNVFSTSAAFELSLRGSTPITTRFPTDAEWLERHRAVKTVIAKYGAGSRTITSGMEEADAQLLAKIQTSGEAVTDGFEANALIGKLVRAEARQATAVPEGFEVPVVTVGGILTKHTLRIPSERELRTYRRGAFTFIDLRHGQQELKTSPAAIGEFYDKLIVKTEGYEGDVPVVHKQAAVIELTQAVDALDQEADPESFI